MKQEFTTAWRASVQPRKQRKYLHNMPLHLKQKQMSATLSKDLRKKHGRRNIEVRKGDEVYIMRGKFKKRSGKITDVNISKGKVAIENIQGTKRDGSKVSVWLRPAMLRINVLTLDDKKRIKVKKLNKTQNNQNAQHKK